MLTCDCGGAGNARVPTGACTSSSRCTWLGPELAYDSIAELAAGDDGRFGLHEVLRFKDPVKCCAPVTVRVPALESGPLVGDDAEPDCFDDDAADDDVDRCELELLEPQELDTSASRTTAPATAGAGASPTRRRRRVAPQTSSGRPGPRPPSPTIRIPHPRVPALPVGHGAEYPGPRPE